MLRIEYERRKRGWSQRELGQRAGLSHVTVSLIERGYQAPSEEALDRIARALLIATRSVLLREVRVQLEPEELDAKAS